MSWANSQRFWSEQRSWYAEFTERQKKANTTASRLLEHKRDLWEARKTYYLRALKSVTTMDNSTIKIEPDQAALHKMTSALIDAVAPALSAAYDKHLGDLALNALRQWPVFTGLSKSLLTLSYTYEGDGAFVARLHSRAPYTIYIEDQPHRKLMFLPADKATDDIAKETLDILAKV